MSVARFEKSYIDVYVVCAASSRGRGTRAAGWFADYVAGRGDAEMESIILEGGIKGWATGGSQFVERMDEYDASFWAGA